MIRLTIPSKYIKKAPISGNPDYISTLAEYATNMYIYGAKPISSGGITTVDLTLDAEADFDIDHFNMLTQLPDIKVDFYNPFIKVAETDIDNAIPEGLSNRTYKEQVDTTIEKEIETGEEIQVPVYETRIHTWRTWRDNSHPLSEPIEGYYYFMSATFGKSLSSEELYIIHNSIHADLIDYYPLVNNKFD